MWCVCVSDMCVCECVCMWCVDVVTVCVSMWCVGLDVVTVCVHVVCVCVGGGCGRKSLRDPCVLTKLQTQLKLSIPKRDHTPNPYHNSFRSFGLFPSIFFLTLMTSQIPSRTLVRHIHLCSSFDCAAQAITHMAAWASWVEKEGE